MDEILARAGIFQGVEPSAVSALTKQLQPVDFPRGHTVFAEGEPGDRLYIIISGKVKIGRRSPDGRENLLTIMGPSDMFGELSIFDPGPRTSSATAVTEVRTYTMDRTALREWIGKRPEIAEQLLRVLARRLRRTNNMLADLIFTDVPGRVAQWADRADALVGDLTGDAASGARVEAAVKAFGARGLATLFLASAAGSGDADRLLERVLGDLATAPVATLRDDLGDRAAAVVDAEVQAVLDDLGPSEPADDAAAGLRVRLAELRRLT